MMIGIGSASVFHCGREQGGGILLSNLTTFGVAINESDLE